VSAGEVDARGGATPSGVAGRDRLIASRADLDAALDWMARNHRMVFFAGLPGVGKSLYIRELARIGDGLGRRVHSLQWDVARPAFVSPSIAARYPDREGIAHPMVRKGVGQWVRQAVVRWNRDNAGDASLLIGEVPLIGHRLVELVQAHGDAAERLLADPQSLFVTPVPSVEVRAAIERARQRTFTNPSNPRESEDAPVNVVQESWAEIRSLAVDLGIAEPAAAETSPFDPDVYAGAYRHLLRRRNALTLRVEAELAQTASVYDHDVQVTDIVPSHAEADAIVARLERELTSREVEAEVARWAQSI
jgi:hypothetical protein